MIRDYEVRDCSQTCKLGETNYTTWESHRIAAMTRDALVVYLCSHPLCLQTLLQLDLDPYYVSLHSSISSEKHNRLVLTPPCAERQRTSTDQASMLHLPSFAHSLGLLRSICLLKPTLIETEQTEPVYRKSAIKCAGATASLSMDPSWKKDRQCSHSTDENLQTGNVSSLVET